MTTAAVTEPVMPTTATTATTTPPTTTPAATTALEEIPNANFVVNHPALASADTLVAMMNLNISPTGYSLKVSGEPEETETNGEKSILTTYVSDGALNMYVYTNKETGYVKMAIILSEPKYIDSFGNYISCFSKSIMPQKHNVDTIKKVEDNFKNSAKKNWDVTADDFSFVYMDKEDSGYISFSFICL